MNRASLKKLRETVRRRPGDAQAWCDLGLAAIGDGDVEEARYALAQSVYLAPQDMERGLSAAQALLDLGYMVEAEHSYRRLLERAPRSSEAREGLVRTFLLAGDPDTAARELAPGLRDDPRHVGLRLLAANLSQQRGALAEAADHLAAVLAVDLEHVEANRQLGQLLSVLGDADGAVRCWRRVVAATGSTDPDAMTALGIALSSNGQHGEAIRVLQEIVSRFGEVSSAHANFGMALLADGKMDEAAAALGRALDIDPQSAQAHCGLGLSYQRQGLWREAAEEFKVTEQLAPDHVVGAFNLGLALQALGDDEGARRALLRAAALDPDDEEIRRALEQTLARDAVPKETADAPSVPLSIKGNLQSFQLFDVLEFLRLQSKSGSVVVSGRQGAGTIRMARGAVTSASAPGVPRLGEALIAKHLVRPQDVEEALAHQRSGAEHDNPEALGEVLLARKLVTREALAKVLLEQIMGALEAMTSWAEGGFFFHPQDDAEPPTVVFNLQEVMLEFLRSSDERKEAERSSSPDSA